MNLRTIYGRLTAGHCALNQRTAECGRERACYGEIRSTGCGPPVEETEERAARLPRYIPQGAATIKACATAEAACVFCPFLPSPFALRTYIYIYIAKSQMEHDHWPRFARSHSPLDNKTGLSISGDEAY